MNINIIHKTIFTLEDDKIEFIFSIYHNDVQILKQVMDELAKVYTPMWFSGILPYYKFVADKHGLKSEISIKHKWYNFFGYMNRFNWKVAQFTLKTSGLKKYKQIHQILEWE